ncbi:MAG: hypothetical protein ABIN97_11855, partial [Ginsengibacter sp.]
KETEKQKGTGIGLALSLSLAQLHKGIIDLKKPENNMNIFLLTMPLHQDKEFELSHEKVKETFVTEVNEGGLLKEPFNQQNTIIKE